LDPVKVIASGISFHKYAMKAKSSVEAKEYLEKAIEQFSKAAAVRPDYYKAQSMWARCLFTLAQKPTDTAARTELMEAVRKRCAAAARCADVEWTLYQMWGQAIASEVDQSASSREERVSLLGEAREAFEKGLELTGFGADRAALQRDLGSCLVLLGDDNLDPAEKQRLYGEAVENFTFASKAAPRTLDSNTYATWGLALLNLGRLKHETVHLYEAVDRLQSSIKNDSKNPNTHYNLACAYALLDQPQEAMRHLRVCLDHDSQGEYSKMAAKDRDLKSLHNNVEYRKIFGEGSAPSTDALALPRVPDR
jgi:tetratricopeptide (TPR) repeat protein